MAQENSLILVEDDAPLARMVSEFLTQNGFTVAVEGNGTLAVERIISGQPAAVILDINLPGKDGFQICREVRSRYDGTIIILTARGDEIDEVVGLEIGADDFMAKPVRPRALLARLNTHLRRPKNVTQEVKTSKISVGTVEIETANRTCRLAGDEIELTTAEFDLLFLLAKHAGETLSRSHLYDELNGFRYDGLDRSIDLRVSRLRKKLKDDSSRPQLIKSVRGVGYMLAKRNG
ncbi:MAG: response regulator transcription factor [Pirellulaceae bacterium]|nr:response regulator transcription factor [Pirellulaceae bacterium]